VTWLPLIPPAEVQNSSIDSEFQNFQDLQFISEPGTLHSSKGLGRPRKANPMGPELTNEQLKARMPSLRDPNAERGPPRLSMAEWLASAKSKTLPHTVSDMVIAQETSSQADLPAAAAILPAQSSTPMQLGTRTIIPDAEDGSAINSEAENDAENDAIGVEDFSESQTEFNDQDPGLANLEDEKSNTDANTGPKRQPVPIPEWFTKALDVKLALIQHRDSNGKFTFYTQYQNFWVPQKAKWFQMRNAKVLRPEILYDFELFYWDPQLLVMISCPLCKKATLTRHGIQKRPRRCVGLEKSFWMIGARYKCPDCVSATGKHTVTFMSWDSRIIASLPQSLAAEFPVVLTHRSALSSPILALERCLFQKGIGSKQFSEIIKSLHLRYFDQLHLQYLQMIQDNRERVIWKNFKFEPFSEFTDSKGYAGFIPSSVWFRDLYDQFIESHLPRINQYSAMLTARVCAIDHSHKITKHIVQINSVPVFVGLLTITNEYGEIRILALVATKAHAQFETALLLMKQSLELYGHQMPSFFFTDNMSDKAFLERCFPSLTVDVVPVDKYAKLPLLNLPLNVKIHIKSNATQMMAALACIQEKLDLIPEDDKLMIGFDMEWNVDLTPGQYKNEATAVVAIAFENHIFILQIASFTKLKKIPPALKNILVQPRILKAGRGIQSDLKRLQRETGIKEEFLGGVDLAAFAKKCHTAPNAKVGLAELSALVLNHRLEKNEAIRISTEWDNNNLSNEQIKYAALDAYASQAIYNRLIEIEKFGKIPENVKEGLAVIIYQQDGQKVIAHGTWSSINFQRDQVIDGINFKAAENMKLVAIDIQKILIPAATVPTHHGHALKDFGLPPFTVIFNRNQVHAAFPEVEDSTPDLHSRQDRNLEIQSEANNIVKEYLSTDINDDSWTRSIDDDCEANPAMSTINQHEIDLENLRIGAEFISYIPTFEPVIRSRVLKDIWHIFDMISISKSHSLRQEFARTLRDAVFLINEEDRAHVDARLRSEGSSFEEKLKYQPKYLWRLVRRHVPPPEKLYKLVYTVFETYGPLKDTLTGQPLFTPNAWKNAKNVLKLIEAGYMSDPPGVSLYYDVGLDRKENGLTVWRCIRGTNFTEGGVHHSIRSCFPDSVVSTRNAVNRLADFQLHHNLRVGTLNRTGHKYSGHDDIWLYDDLQLTIEETRYAVPTSYEIKGWINGLLYQPTSEVSGILPIPSSIQRNAGLQAIVHNPTSKLPHQYLANRQGTRFAVIGIHSSTERKLFSQLMRENSSFNRDKKDPDWKAAIQIWNTEYADGKTIFYKV